MNYIIELTDKDLTAEVSSGMAIDVLAKSIGQYDSNEMYEACMDGEHYAVEYVTDNFDYENYIINWLNNNPKDLLNLYPKYEKQNLKAGAFVALNYPEIIEMKTEELKDIVWDYRDVNFVEDFGGELAQEVEEAITDYNDQNYKEWLYGDRDFVGILKLAEREYGAEDVSYKDGVITFEFTAEQAKDFIDDEDVKHDNKTLKVYLVGNINARANNVLAKEEAENAKRREQYAKTTAYQAERKQREEAERKEKLLAMTK